MIERRENDVVRLIGARVNREHLRRLVVQDLSEIAPEMFLQAFELGLDKEQTAVIAQMLKEPGYEDVRQEFAETARVVVLRNTREALQVLDRDLQQKLAAIQVDSDTESALGEDTTVFDEKFGLLALLWNEVVAKRLAIIDAGEDDVSGSEVAKVGAKPVATSAETKVVPETKPAAATVSPELTHPLVDAFEEKIRYLEDKLSEAITSGVLYDPRVRVDGKIPLVELEKSQQYLSEVLPEKSDDLSKNMLRKRILALLDAARNIAHSFIRYLETSTVSAVDQSRVQAAVDSSSLFGELQTFETVAVNRLGKTRAETEKTQLETLQSRIAAEIAAIPTTLDSATISELAQYFPGQNFDFLQEFHKNAWRSIDSRVKQAIVLRANRIVALEQARKTEAEIKQKISELKSDLLTVERNEAPFLDPRADNALDTRVSPFYQKLAEVAASETLPEAEYMRLELEVLLFDYRLTKKTLEKFLTAHENSQTDFKDFVGQTRQLVFGTWITSRFDAVLRKLNSTTYPGADAALLAEIDRDKQRVIADAGRRMAVYMTEQSLDTSVWWNQDPSDKASRGIPRGASAFWSVDQSVIATTVAASEPIPTDTRLRYEGEKDRNPALTPRRVMARDFEDIAVPKEILFTPTTFGEIMRLLDRLYANKIPAGHEHLEGFFKTMHLNQNRDKIPEIICQMAKSERGLTISENQVWQAFYLHALFFNHSMLMQGSANISDSAMYANNLLGYGLSEQKQGVITYSLEQILRFFGRYDAKADINSPLSRGNPRANKVGRIYHFDTLGTVLSSELSKARSLFERIAFGLVGTNTEKSLPPREKMIHAVAHFFEEKRKHDSGIDVAKKVKEYEFLFDLPWITIDKTVFGTYPVFPLPLQFMIFKDPTASYSKRYPSEKLVKRTKNKGSGNAVGAPVTAADYVTEDGEILYELIPWNDAVPLGSLADWFNNGSNLLGLYEVFRAKATHELAGTEVMNALRKTAKYGAIFLPQFGLEALAGRVDGEKLFRKFAIIHVLSQSILLLRENHQNINQIQDKLIELTEDFGHETIEVIEVMLKALLGAQAQQDRYQELTTENLKNLFKFT